MWKDADGLVRPGRPVVPGLTSAKYLETHRAPAESLSARDFSQRIIACIGVFFPQPYQLRSMRFTGRVSLAV